MMALTTSGEASASPIPSSPVSVRTRTSTASWLLAVFASTFLIRRIWQTTWVIFISDLQAQHGQTVARMRVSIVTRLPPCVPTGENVAGVVAEMGGFAGSGCDPWWAKPTHPFQAVILSFGLCVAREFWRCLRVFRGGRRCVWGVGAWGRVSVF